MALSKTGSFLTKPEILGVGVFSPFQNKTSFRHCESACSAMGPTKVRGFLCCRLWSVGWRLLRERASGEMQEDRLNPCGRELSAIQEISKYWDAADFSVDFVCVFCMTLEHLFSAPKRLRNIWGKSVQNLCKNPHKICAPNQKIARQKSVQKIGLNSPSLWKMEAKQKKNENKCVPNLCKTLAPKSRQKGQDKFRQFGAGQKSS